MVLRCNKENGGGTYFEIFSPRKHNDNKKLLKNKDKDNDYGGESKGTCFPFRPPRSITTEWSHQGKDKTTPEQDCIPDMDHTWDAEDSSYHQHPVSTSKLSKRPETTNESQTHNLPPSSETNGNVPPLTIDTGHNNVITPTKKNLSKQQTESPDILSMPIPRDRSHRQRLRAERERGQIHTYTGEQEPAGFRGQEAQVKTNTPVGSTYLQLNQEGAALRLFESSPSKTSPKNQDDSFNASPKNQDDSLNTSASSDVHIRHMVSDLVPLTPSVLERPKRNISSFDERKRMRKDTPTKSTYGGDSRKQQNTSKQGGTSDYLLSITRHTSNDDVLSVYTSSTHSSDTLENMKEDLQDMGPTPKFSNNRVVPSFDVSSSFDVKEMSEVAHKHVQLGEFDRAIVQYGRILAFYQSYYGDPHPLVASARHNLGMVHLKKADSFTEDALQQNYSRQEALICFQSAARTARDSLSKNHPNVAVSLVKVGFLLLQSKQYQVALITFKEAIRIRLIHFGSNPHPLIANLHNNIGTCQFHLGNFQESNQHFTKALQIQRHLLRLERINSTGDRLQIRLLEVADTLSNLGGLGLEWLRQHGTYAQSDIMLTAQRQIEEAVAIRSSILGLEHPLTIQVIDSQKMLISMSSKVSEAGSTHSDRETRTKDIDPPTKFSFDEHKSDDYISDLTNAINQSKNSEEQPSSVFDGIDNPWSSISPDTSDLHYSCRTEDFEKDDELYFSSTSNSPESYQKPSPSEMILLKVDAIAFDYDTEECCLVGGIGEKEYFSVPSVLQFTEKDMAGEENISSHEITVLSPNIDGLFRSPLAKHVGAQEISNSYDDGIAPLHSSAISPKSMSSDLTEEKRQTVALTGSMLDNPEAHLVEVHAAACRCLKRNRLAEAQYLFKTIFECQRKVLGECHEDVGAALHNVGLAYLRSNDHTQALDYFERAVRTKKGSLGMGHLEVAISQFKVGVTQLLMRNVDLSLAAFLEALSIRKHALGALNLSLARIYNNIGCILLEMNKLVEAKKVFEGALDIQRKALSHEPKSRNLMYGAALTLCNLGYLYRHKEMHQNVTVVLKEALDLLICVLGETHPTVLTTMDNLADALSLSEGCSEALQALRYYSKILSKLKEVGDVKNKSQTEAVVLYKMSRIHRQQKDSEAELDTLERALIAVKAIPVRTELEKRTKMELKRYIRADILTSSPIKKKPMNVL
mmetsp:Transcript_19453/g.28831  ORF Transcript_19453/g.28831 Transcript_19453/m.28831 type:complete len:1202 (-) Transcript_19453:323-3928(-)|eukprot:CAMPEP_0194225526 /NCGR_PEP_ID=MMETSP0156-20130528/39791_1 /TAXON_ID=33649 /ORGANISM="Thalassionema nitzschioides, Strain L26-B" /LENGTH=1201 /DNA_ID=CAMNT_0038957503 /DNA_START=42 /DNA_END=3647 /DNA_ORIENTATION=-